MNKESQSKSKSYLQKEKKKEKEQTQQQRTEQQKESPASSLITQRASQLGLIELGLGSFLHALKIPFRGHVLSLNQGYLLARTVRDLGQPENAQESAHRSLRLQAAQSSFEISVIASLVKSLSPTVDKLGPMLAISLQGVFFALGPLVFGANFLGSLAGAWLLALYTFIQSLFSFFLAFGYDLQLVFQSYLQQTGKDFQSTTTSLTWIALILVFTKLILATSLTFWAYAQKSKSYTKNVHTSSSTSFLQRGLEKLQSPQRPPQQRGSILQKVIRDITRPLFLFSLFLLFLFSFLTQKSFIQIFIHLARPIAIAFIFSALYYSVWVKNFLNRWIDKSDYLKSLREKSAQILSRLR